MLIARDNTGLVKASKRSRANCPSCGSEVIAKVGDIRIAHWAHIAEAQCDSWYEPETEWHAGWKETLVPTDRMEVRIENHRADAVGVDGTIVEVQNSRLSKDDIIERERFYCRNGTKLIWLFNTISEFSSKQSRFEYVRSSTRHVLLMGIPRKNEILYCAQIVLLDAGNGLLINLRLWNYENGSGFGVTSTIDEIKLLMDSGYNYLQDIRRYACVTHLGEKLYGEYASTSLAS